MSNLSQMSVLPLSFKNFTYIMVHPRCPQNVHFAKTSTNAVYYMDLIWQIMAPRHLCDIKEACLPFTEPEKSSWRANSAGLYIYLYKSVVVHALTFFCSMSNF